MPPAASLGRVLLWCKAKGVPTCHRKQLTAQRVIAHKLKVYLKAFINFQKQKASRGRDSANCTLTNCYFETLRIKNKPPLPLQLPNTIVHIYICVDVYIYI